MNDIDLTDFLSLNGLGHDNSEGWLPIGTEHAPFQGNFNGGGHKIKGLWIDRPDVWQVGLFGAISHGAIENLGIEIAKKGISGGASVGGLAGDIDNAAIKNCYVTGNVTGNHMAGGLIGAGTGENTSVIKCFASGNIHAATYAGGLMGNAENGSIEQCWSSSRVSASHSDAGGLLGSGGDGLKIKNCFAIGNVSSENYAGGLISFVREKIKIENCYAAGRVSGTFGIGGFAGEIMGGAKIAHCFFDREVSGKKMGVGVGPDSGITGKTTIEMKTKSTFTNAGWDFAAVWDMNKGVNGGYPYLRGMKAPPPPPPKPDGSAENPFLISTPKDLNGLREYLGETGAGKYFKLTNDIDLTDFLSLNGLGRANSEGWLPIGSTSAAFQGNLNGDCHKISGLWINRPEGNDVGLFGAIEHGTIRNLGIEIASEGITASDNAGGFAGGIINATFKNCYVTGNVTSIINAGGFAGFVATGTSIENCYTSGKVSANKLNAGGFAGVIHSSTINQCWSNCDVSSDDSIGGLFGHGHGFFTVKNCFARGNVSGVFRVGGLIGTIGNFSAAIENCYAAGRVAGRSFTGGFVGEIMDGVELAITDCFFDSDVTEQANAVGYGSDDGITGKTTDEMKTESTFTSAEWDFKTIWGMKSGVNGGYPYLRGMTAPLPPPDGSAENPLPI